MSDLERQDKLNLINQLEVKHVGHDRNGVPFVLVKSGSTVVDFINRLAAHPESYLYTMGIRISQLGYHEDPGAAEYLNIAPLAYEECGATAFVNGKFV